MARAIINFHGIGPVPRPLAPGEDDFWLDMGQFRAVLDLVMEMAPELRPLLTFDDGNLSDIDRAAPELAARGLKAQFFALSGRLGERYFLGAGHLRDLRAAGHGIGLHGADHVDWRGLDAEGQRREFVDARQILEDASGSFITAAAVPFGRYDRRVLRQLRAAGFSAVYTSDCGVMRPGAWLCPRSCLRHSMDQRVVLSCLTGRVPLQQRPRRWIGVVRKRALPILA
ncbi:polysaccharide deacetylase family protein [Roseicitreum antarcticum]|uniref:Chitooligosaccharide deacetylase n=1 Tax=Roseicitreum antarcticum TaxID=564137 RepID=A0A1H2UMC7_9RHOB|nr:polysaccharide deacetylase family protein [Roseicitreum antarcticum]SDW57250.1 Polysaccharide deacetylase [Roseicitreum antarcticum]